MAHFRNSYHNSFGQSNNWYGNCGSQFGDGQLARNNPSQQAEFASWNGWRYNSGLNQRQQQPEAQQSSTGQSDANVRYVQLNWNDILGVGQGGQSPVTSTGPSAFQMDRPSNSSYTYQGFFGVNGDHVGIGQNQQTQPAARFVVSLGNQGGDQGQGATLRNNDGTGDSIYEIISPQIPAPTSGGDQVGLGNGQNDGNATTILEGNPVAGNVETGTGASTTAGVQGSAIPTKKGEKYAPCGNCKACKFQKARKSASPFATYLIRDMSSNSNKAPVKK